MPLIYHQQLNNHTKIGVWHITEIEDFFLEKYTLQQNITHPLKRLQHIAGRHLLIVLFPNFPIELIKIADTRKPYLPNEAYHFSISHCGDYAAVIVSTHNRVGVDVEVPNPKVERIKSKFLSQSEMDLLNPIHKLDYAPLTMAWSVKEAIFKWYGLGQVDFKKHINIVSIENLGKEIIANCTFSKQEEIFLQVKSIIIDGINVSWVVD